MSAPEDDVVAVRTYANEVEADLAASWLAAEGVDSMVLMDDAGGTLPSFQLMGGVRLVVRAEDEDRAKEILETAEREADVDPEA
jgi:hypothetical protein